MILILQFKKLWSNLLISYLKFILFDNTLLKMLANFMQNCKHCNVGLSSPSRGTNQHVLIGVVGSLKHNWLDSIESPHSFKSQLPNLERERERKKERNKWLIINDTNVKDSYQILNVNTYFLWLKKWLISICPIFKPKYAHLRTHNYCIILMHLGITYSLN